MEQLRSLASTGKLRSTDLIRNDKSDWRQADSISGLFPQAGNRKTPPKLPSARLNIVRKPKLTGFLSSVSVKIDGEDKGSLGGGIPSGMIDLLTSNNKSTSIELDSGTHQIEVSGGGLKTEKTINLKPGQVLRLITLFSNMGAMGGGLKLEEDPSSSSVPSQTNIEPKAQRKNWTLKGILGLCVVCFGFFILCAGILGGIAGSSRGTITFAEEVNEKTLETTNEGTEFTTGWVAMIIRSRKAFGESKLIITYRKNGEQMWQVLDQHSVDPQWDMIAAPVLLAEPGDYEIAAKTASGKLIAKNTVTIIP